ncbi:class IV adenylate cyclase [Candidatus Babeliales bacterium]|nr:class IV adenylate cyclase [Candidatus Babeliales bacterium]
MNKEIEIKFQLELDKNSFFGTWLEDNAMFKGNIKITDFYLNNPKLSYYFITEKGYKEILEFLRVRITDEKNYLCYKKRHLDSSGKTISVDELEVVVNDGLQTVKILEHAGYTDKIKIEKTRSIFMYEDFEIVLDTVEGLGSFIEIEIKEHEHKTEKDLINALDRIYDLLRKIGLPEIKIFDRGYLCMFLNPGYDFSEIIKL